MPAYLKYDGTPAAVTADPTHDTYSQAGAETMTGTAAAESFWVDEGDVALGGAGDDTYWLKALKGHLSITELAGGGIDKVAGWQNIKLADYPNVENVYVGNDNTYGAGDAGDNVIEGGAGSQQLYGGGGQDVLVGGAGADTFIVKKGEGSDVIQDFSASEDKVRLTAGFTTFDQVKAHMTQVGADVKLDLGNGDGLMFRNITVGAFTASNFQLQLDPAKLGAKTFGDEFNTLSLWDKESNPGGTWRTDFGYQGTQGVGSYSLVSNEEKQIYISPYFRDHNGDFESPFSTGDGTLTITARPSTSSEIFGYGYTSGMITSQPTFAQTYGYFEMRAELPHADGAWPAFWLIPADGSWPPELDVMETLTSDPNADWTTAHSGVGGHSANGIFSFIPDTADGYHTYGALWTPTDLVWYVDGVEVFHTATPADMNKPMYMIANLALGGWGGAIDNGDLPAQLKIDYIHAYSLAGTSTGGTTTPAPTPTPAPTTTTASATGGAAAAGGQSLYAVSTGDTLTGGAGDDQIYGGGGQDYLRGGDGADTITGGDSFDDINGNKGDDVAHGGLGDDWVVGGQDNDQLWGDEGGDIVYGNLGNDTLDGGAGNDLIRGGQGDDVLTGGAGADWMSGDKGNDTLTGGAGADIFHSFGDAGIDRVLDFNVTEGDRVQLDPGTQYTVAQEGADTVIHMTGGAEMVLVGVQLSSLGSGWIFGA
jgi:beta-glucanase (GH16 family)